MMALLNAIFYVVILMIIVIILNAIEDWLKGHLNNNADLFFFVFFVIIAPLALAVVSLFLMVDGGYLPMIFGG